MGRSFELEFIRTCDKDLVVKNRFTFRDFAGEIYAIVFKGAILQKKRLTFELFISLSYLIVLRGALSGCVFALGRAKHFQWVINLIGVLDCIWTIYDPLKLKLFKDRFHSTDDLP